MELARAAAFTISAVPEESQDNAAAYLHERPLGPGTVLLVDRRAEVITTAIYLGFVDCDPGKNWGHRCRYVRCGIDNDSVEVTEAQFPPAVEGQRLAWVMTFVGREVPDWAVFPTTDPQ
jgi:hypothetical protein